MNPPIKTYSKYFINVSDREFELKHKPKSHDLTIKILPNGYAVFGYLMNDPLCDNPLESQDGIGHIYSLNQRHSNFGDKEINEAMGLDQYGEPYLDLVDQEEVRRRFLRKHGEHSEDSIGPGQEDELDEIALELWKEGRKNGTIGDPDAVPLSYFEHGVCLWDVAGGKHISGCPDMRWDGCKFAGLWLPDDCVRESYTGQDGKTRQEWMREQAASACEQYTDWCNGECFSVHTETFNPQNERIDEDSCHGYVGREWAEKELNDWIESECKKIAGL